GYASTVSKPTASNAGRAASTTAPTSGSTGIEPPQVGDHATRGPRTSPSIASGGSPDIADHNRATSGTVRAIGPSVERSSGSSPVNVGRKPHQLAELHR